MNRPVPPQYNPNDLAWWKSSESSENGACVEVARAPEGWMAMRDSKITDGARVLVPTSAFSTFVNGVRAGEL
ncbi:DUF397 domain-containing protein [Streptomyces sp. NPDC048518]|uniref:DUF397 domain-containing protein n=1 Tax=Streptomyces sp. NPDC048518 TaxID=3155029 RepID=UPI0033CAFB26